MDELLLRFLRGDTTPPEEDRIAEWLAESNENERRLQELRELVAVARASDAWVDPGAAPRAGEVIERAAMEMPAPTVKNPVLRRQWVRGAVALAAAAAFVTLGAFGYGRWGPRADSARLTAAELTTSAGESTTVRMSDGSVIRLGPQSRLEVMAGEMHRQVVLTGRAFFAVAPDEDRPFKVLTPSGSVRVVGTRFELKTDISELRLVVVEGSVALATQGSEVQVDAGRMTVVSGGNVAEVQSALTLGELSAEWMGQFLVFQNTPLSKAATEIEQLYGVDIQIVDPRLEQKTLTMWFSSRPLEDVMSVVCSVIVADCRIENSVVTIEAS